MFMRVLVCVAVAVLPFTGPASADRVTGFSAADQNSEVVEEVQIITLGVSKRLAASSGCFLGRAVRPDDEVLDLLDRRRSPVVSRRVQAACELWELGVEAPAEIDAVSAWLDREDEPWVRRYLLLTLLDLDDETITVGLIEDEDPEGRSIIARYIGDYMVLGIGMETVLLDVYRSADPWWVRVPFLAAFAEGVRDESLDILHDALQDPARDVRGAAVMALEERADPRSLDPLLGALEDKELIGADSPVWGLAQIGDPSTIPWIESAAASASPQVRQEAAQALGALDATDSTELLVRLLDDVDRRVVDLAATSLTTLGIEPAVLDAVEACSLFDAPSLDVLKPEARIVVPAGGGSVAEAWEIAPGVMNGGVRHEVRAGCVALVVAGASEGDEVWLEVAIEDSDFDTAWIREKELHRIPAEEALAIVNGTIPRP